MSLIVAKPSVSCSSTTSSGPMVLCDYYPAVAKQKVVLVTATETVDSASMTDFRAVKWLVSVSNPSLSRVQTLEVYATHRAGLLPTFNTYSFLGDLSVQFTVDVTNVGGNLNLNITNTDTETLTIYSTRFAVPISNTTSVSTQHVELKKINTVVRANTTGFIDFIPTPTTGVLGAKWNIVVTTATGLRKSSQVFSVLSAGGVNGNHYSIIGDLTLGYNIILTEIIGQGIELHLQNLTANNYSVDVTCIPIQAVTSLPANCIPTANDLKVIFPTPLIIQPGSTRIVDTLLPAHNVGAKWFFTAIESTTNNTTAYEILATNQTNIIASHVLYGIIGDSLLLTVTTSMVVGRLILEVINNQTNPVTINLLRLPTVV